MTSLPTHKAKWKESGGAKTLETEPMFYSNAIAILLVYATSA